MLVPTASGTLDLPAGTSTATVFVCVEESVRALHRAQSLWNDRVTRRDLSAGLIETGDFDDDNVIGFRVRVRSAPGSSEATVQIKGAGAYFTDLGVDKALSDFEAGMRACLPSPP